MIQICVHTGTGDGDNVVQDFHGFRFLEYGKTEFVELSSTCPDNDWRTINLEGKRAVGFKAVIADNPTAEDDTARSIRAICPLVDDPGCGKAEFTAPAVTHMTAVIGGGREYQVFVTDNISKYYGTNDGFTFCSD